MLVKKTFLAALALPLPLALAGPNDVLLDGNTALTVPGDHAVPWSFDGTLTVGQTNGSNASLTLTSGLIQDFTTLLGANAGAEGSLLVTGADAVFDNRLGTFMVGAAGTGTLTLADGGTVKVGGPLTVANQAGSTGTLNIGTYDLSAPTAAGVLQATSVKLGSGSGVINFNQTGDLAFATPITGAGSVVQRGGGTTTLSVANTFTGPTTISAGTLRFATRGSLAAANWTPARFTVGPGATASFAVGGASGFTDADLATLTALGSATGGSTLELFTAGATPFIYTGSLSDTNSGANVMRLAVAGTGTLVLQGAATHTGGTVVHGGTLQVDGGSLSHPAADLVVGDTASATATAAITGGGEIHDDNAFVGTGGTGAVSVAGAGSTWTTDGSLSLGHTSPGSLAVSAGGHVTAASITLGTSASGSATVNGAGSQLASSGDFAVGVDGPGTLTIEAGAVVTVGSGGSGSLSLSPNVTAVGALNIGAYNLAHPTAGGTLQAAGVILGSDAAVVNFNQTGSTTFGVPISGAGSVVQRGSGTTLLTGANTYTGATTITAGTLTVSAGSISHYASDVTVSGGAFRVENGGSATDSFGRVLSGASATVSGTGSKWTSGDFEIGSSASAGTVQVETGGAVSANGTILGADTGSSGSATVSGFGSTWATGGLVVGNFGTGSFTVEDGSATVSFGADLGVESGSSGTIGVTGSGRLAITGGVRIGFSGNGTLTVGNGGTLNADTITLGQNTGSAGTLIVTGEDSFATNTGDLLVGSSGLGTLNVLDGGVMNAGRVYIGSLAGTAHATVSGESVFSNSSLGASGEIQVGSFGPGALDVLDGAMVTDTDGVVGHGSASPGTVKISGPGANWINVTSLTVGRGSSGTVTVQNGGGVKVGASGDGVLNLGSSVTGATGTLNIGSPDLAAPTTAGNVYAAEVALATDPAAIVFSQTNAITFSPLISGVGGVVQQGTGITTLVAANTYTGGTTILGGTLVAGSTNAFGTGDVVIKGGSLQIQSGITIANTVVLSGGSLSKELAGGTELASLGTFKGNVSGGAITTVASLLGGTTTGSATLQTGFATLSSASNDSTRQSDIFTLSGMPVVDALTGATDTFVLQLSIPNVTADSFLAWYNPSSMAWVNAVEGNHGGTNHFNGIGAYDPETDFHLGTWGVDVSDGTVWAVLNHNSDFAINSFAAVPESASYGIGIAALLGGAILLRRHRTRTL